MKIATWNVNSIKARLPLVLRWLADATPDILMMQELKGTDFPESAFRDAGYESAAVSQKAYNGVATLSRRGLSVIRKSLPGDPEDNQARYLEIDSAGVRLINIYLPNGNPVPGEKFDYKLRWMDRLAAHLEALRAERIPFLVAGDFNVIPEDRDCHDPVLWAEDALFRPETRAKFRTLLHLGLTDAFRVFYEDGGHYTFWDYQGRAWEAQKGIRIDHALLSPPLTDRLVSCMIDPAPRGWEQPSDHVPVSVEIEE